MWLRMRFLASRTASTSSSTCTTATAASSSSSGTKLKEGTPSSVFAMRLRWTWVRVRIGIRIRIRCRAGAANGTDAAALGHWLQRSGDAAVASALLCMRMLCMLLWMLLRVWMLLRRCQRRGSCQSFGNDKRRRGLRHVLRRSRIRRGLTHKRTSRRSRLHRAAARYGARTRRYCRRWPWRRCCCAADSLPACWRRTDDACQALGRRLWGHARWQLRQLDYGARGGGGDGDRGGYGSSRWRGQPCLRLHRGHGYGGLLHGHCVAYGDGAAAVTRCICCCCCGCCVGCSVGCCVGCCRCSCSCPRCCCRRGDCLLLLLLLLLRVNVLDLRCYHHGILLLILPGGDVTEDAQHRVTDLIRLRRKVLGCFRLVREWSLWQVAGGSCVRVGVGGMGHGGLGYWVRAGQCVGQGGGEWAGKGMCVCAYHNE